MSQVIWVRGKVLISNCWWKFSTWRLVQRSIPFFFQIFFLSSFVTKVKENINTAQEKLSKKKFPNYVQVMGLELIKTLSSKVLSSVITKWNPRTNCPETRGVSSNGLWGTFWLMHGFLLSLFFYSLLALPGDSPKGTSICLLKSEIFFSCDI